MTNQYAIPKDDLPDELGPLLGLEEVDSILEYQTHYAEYSILLDDEVGRVQQIRVFYLRNLRDKWEWVTSTDKGIGHVLIKRRDK